MKVALKNYKSTHVHILIDAWGGNLQDIIH